MIVRLKDGRAAIVPFGVEPEVFRANLEEQHRLIIYAQRQRYHLFCAFCDAGMSAHVRNVDYQRTRGHLVPRCFDKQQQPRLWLYQCRRCNSGQKGYTVYGWHSVLTKGRDPRARNVGMLITELLGTVSIPPHRLGIVSDGSENIRLGESGPRSLSHASVGD